jgi:predicted amidohydrolase
MPMSLAKYVVSMILKEVRMRIGLVQTNSQEDRDQNVQAALKLIEQAATQGAEFVVLPEFVTFLGRGELVWEHAESLDGPSSQSFAAAARRHGIWLLAGSIPERSTQIGKCFNTSLLFDPQGQIAATYRKIHLFDVDIDAGSYRESDAVLPGETPIVARVGDHLLGMSICYDVRFPELYRLLALAGAEMLVVPAAFTAFTGKDHWEVLLRARAIENQCYVLAAGQWGSHPPGRSCYGRSMVINPWGTVVAQAADGVGIVMADLDFALLHKIRAEVPSLANRRPQTYTEPVLAT